MSKEEERSPTPPELWSKDYKSTGSKKDESYVLNGQQHHSQLKPTEEDEQKFLEKLKMYRSKYKERFNPLHLPLYLRSIENFMRGKSILSQGFYDSHEMNLDDFSYNSSMASYSRSSSCESSNSYRHRSSYRSYSRSRSRSPRSSKRRRSSQSRSRSRSKFETSKQTRNRSRSRSSSESSKHKQTKSRPKSPSRHSKASKSARSKTCTKSPERKSTKTKSSNSSLRSDKHNDSKKVILKAENSSAEKVRKNSLKGSKVIKKDILKDTSAAKVHESACAVPNIKTSTNSPATTGQVSAENDTFHDEINIEGFEPSTKNETFTRKNFKIYFTPCFKNLIYNLRNAFKEYKGYEEMLEAFHEEILKEDQLVIWRAFDAIAFLVCGQSLISSVTTIHGSSNACKRLEDENFAILSPLRSVVLQYGEVQNDFGFHLCSIDHDSDIRAIIRIVSQLMPTFGEGVKDGEVQKIVFRSWLPTSSTDRRFLWILACRLNELMNRKIGYAPSPRTIVDAFQQNTKPFWWDNQLSYCFDNSETTPLLNFLFTDNWTEETFYANFALNEMRGSLLKELNLKWKNPMPDHLSWNINADHVIDNVVNTMNLFKELCGSIFPMISQKIPIGHQGSLHQIQEEGKDLNNFFGLGEADSSKREIGVRYPPKVYTEPLSLFYKDLEN